MKVCILNTLEIWNKTKKSLNTRLHSQPVYDHKCIKTKVKTFSSMINALFPGNEIPEERNHCICITAVCIDSILKLEKKNFSQVYIE